MANATHVLHDRLLLSLWRNNHFSEIDCNFVTKQLRNCLKFYELETYDP